MLRRCIRKPSSAVVGVRRLYSGLTHERNYAEAVTKLNSIQSNWSVVEAFRKAGGRKNESAISEMVEWCRRTGLDLDELARLNIVHIAGTKGKGSTSAFISSILGQYHTRGHDPMKVGLYTSPHLRYVRERIQANNAPISEQAFAESFFEVWERLQRAAELDPIPSNQPQSPVYFQFLTILAFHTYLKMDIDTAVVECGIGGEYDSTNVIKSPTTTGITALGLDHELMLGVTVESIAWHKAGIIKPGVPVFTVEQPGKALDVIHERARDRGAPVQVVPVHPDIAKGNIKLGLDGDFQKSNASLAVEIAASQLRALGHSNISTAKLPEEFVRGLETVRFGGRCETRHEPDISWHIDGAHTVESMQVAADWFAGCVLEHERKSAAGKKSPRILIFNQQSRSSEPLMRKLYETMSRRLENQKPFTHVIFCSNLTFTSSGYRPDLISINANAAEVDSLEVQHKNVGIWKAFDNSAEVTVFRSIEEAVTHARQISGVGPGQAQVFAVGSVHLIGGVLEVLES